MVLEAAEEACTLCSSMLHGAATSKQASLIFQSIAGVKAWLRTLEPLLRCETTFQIGLVGWVSNMPVAPLEPTGATNGGEIYKQAMAKKSSR